MTKHRSANRDKQELDQSEHLIRTDYVAHLSKDEDHTITICGEPWQGWQEPANTDREVSGSPLPPMDEPRYGDTIRQCQACLYKALQLGAKN